MQLINKNVCDISELADISASRGQSVNSSTLLIITCCTGNYDEQGLFYVTDRLKELIKVKGLQVAPAELEAVLLTHPMISDVAVIGIPNERLGEAPKAFVVKKEDGLTEKDVHEFLAGKVRQIKIFPKLY